MKTKDRIILASLDLFNEQGERNISTNHIAAHLNMSPGNLYYHFRNKSDIIYEIFKNYELMVDTYLRVPDDKEISLQDLVSILEAVFNGLWAYRFLHRDLEHLLSSDDRLREEYRQFTIRCLGGSMNIINAMERSAISIKFPDTTKQSLALNMWLIVTNWMTYLKTVHGDKDDHMASQQTIKHGVYLILEFIRPYIREERTQRFEELREPYRFGNIIPGVELPPTG